MTAVTPYLRKLHDEHMARRARLFPAKTMEVVTEPRLVEVMAHKPEPEPEPPKSFKPPFFSIISDEPIEPPLIKSVSVREIQIAACRYYGVKLSELLSARRHAQIVRARQVAMYLAKTLTLRSLPEIGRRFGGKDHTTVLHAIRKIEAKRPTDAVLDAQIIELTTQLKPPTDAMD